MAMTVSTNRKISAAGYIRMSSDSQVDSPQRQREDIATFASKNGFVITKWYEDHGQSGVRSAARRAGWQDLIRDAKAGQFQAVIGWTISRFSRSDAMQTAVELAPLREAGIQLVTTDRGAYDWSDFAGQLMISIDSNSANAYSKAIATATTSWQAKKAAKGQWPAGRTPFGMARGKDGKLCPGEKREADIVKAMFKMYASGKSLSVIIDTLSADYNEHRNVSWLSRRLRDVNYTGDFQWPWCTSAKFISMSATGDARLAQRGRVGADDQWNIPSNHKGLISCELFDTVQSMLRAATKFTSPVRNGGKYALGNSMLKCKHCGSVFVGHSSPTSPNSGLTYMCNWRHNIGVQCLSRRVFEADVLKLVCQSLKEWMDPKRIKAMRTEFNKQIAESKQSPSELKSLRSQLDKKEAEFAKARKRILSLNESLIAAFQDDLLTMQKEIDNLRSQVARADSSTADQLTRFDEEIDSFNAIVANMDDLIVNHSGENVEALSAFLRSFIQEIVLDVQAEPQPQIKGKTSRNRYSLVGGEIRLRSGSCSMVW